MSSIAQRNRTVALRAALFGLAMLALAFASVPLYRIFCQVTVRFNADTDPGLPWLFKPEQHLVEAKVGESKLIFYRAENNAGHPVTGQAVFNVTPAKAAAYFTKVECFCFTEQTLQAGQKVDMPVSFFIDPAFMADANMKDVTSITLSYTFYNQTQEASGKTAAAQ